MAPFFSAKHTMSINSINRIVPYQQLFASETGSSSPLTADGVLIPRTCRVRMFLRGIDSPLGSTVTRTLRVGVSPTDDGVIVSSSTFTQFSTNQGIMWNSATSAAPCVTVPGGFYVKYHASGTYSGARNITTLGIYGDDFGISGTQDFTLRIRGLDAESNHEEGAPFVALLDLTQAAVPGGAGMVDQLFALGYGYNGNHNTHLEHSMDGGVTWYTVFTFAPNTTYTGSNGYTTYRGGNVDWRMGYPYGALWRFRIPTTPDVATDLYFKGTCIP